MVGRFIPIGEYTARKEVYSEMSGSKTLEAPKELCHGEIHVRVVFESVIVVALLGKICLLVSPASMEHLLLRLCMKPTSLLLHALVFLLLFFRSNFRPTWCACA